jgi:hypothetical protein
VPAAILPSGELKLLFNLTMAPMPADAKSALLGSSTHPMTLKCKAAVVAIVLIANAADDMPVVVDPLVPLEKFALANTAALAVALFVHDASVATTNNCAGSSATKASTG